VNEGMTSKPLSVHRVAIVTKGALSKGTLGIKPMTENANIEHANIKAATTTVPNGASNVPCCAESIIGYGARAKTNQLGPPKM
jgi:hypothetical protein